MPEMDAPRRTRRDSRTWIGRAVGLSAELLDDVNVARPVNMAMSSEGARKVALVLSRVKQTYFAGLEPEVQELLDALNYVLVGDPDSRAAHRRMEAGKGMEPSGG